MNIGMVQIMWKGIAIGFLVLYAFRNILDIYMVKTYEKMVMQYGQIDVDTLKSKAEKHLKLCDFFSVGPWNKQIYLTYNEICWLLASLSLIEDNEYEFLEYLDKIKKEHEFEMKSFVLALYYRSKKDVDRANHYYNLYLASKHVDNDIAIIMEGIWGKKEKTELFAESIKRFKNPALEKLFNENQIL